MRDAQLKMRVILAMVAAGCFVALLWIVALTYYRQSSEVNATAKYLDKESRAFLAALTSNRANSESGLIAKLIGKSILRRVVWHATFTDGLGVTKHVYLLDIIMRPAASGGVPLICVVTDSSLEVHAWSEVATFSAGLVSAQVQVVDGIAELEITTRANWFAGFGVHYYSISKSEIRERKETQYFPTKSTIPILHYRDPVDLEPALKQIRSGADRATEYDIDLQMKMLNDALTETY